MRKKKEANFKMKKKKNTSEASYSADVLHSEAIKINKKEKEYTG